MKKLELFHQGLTLQNVTDIQCVLLYENFFESNFNPLKINKFDD